MKDNAPPETTWLILIICGLAFIALVALMRLGMSYFDKRLARTQPKEKTSSPDARTPIPVQYSYETNACLICGEPSGPAKLCETHEQALSK